MSEPVVAGKTPLEAQLEPGEYWWCDRGGRSSALRSKVRPRSGMQAPRHAVTGIPSAGRSPYWGPSADAPGRPCGRSKTQPFCDGSHAGTGIEPVAFRVEEQGSYWLCACKHTANPPFCDGAHELLD